jgi:hypothetical protein
MLVGGDGDGAIGCNSPRWGHYCVAPYSYCTKLLGLKPCPYMDVRRRHHKVSCPHWRRRIWRHVLTSSTGGGGWLVELLVRSGRGGAQGPCWRGGAEGSWESAVLGWCACAVVILALA